MITSTEDQKISNEAEDVVIVQESAITQIETAENSAIVQAKFSHDRYLRE